MPRGLILAVIFASSAFAAIWPEHLGDFERKSDAPISVPADGQARQNEYGFVEAERADYGPFQVTASRFKDTTGAYADSLTTPGSLLVGNYVLTCQGKCPKNLPRLAQASLPHVSGAALPALNIYFASKGLIPHSERYIIGPASLSEAAPEIPASAVNFDLSTEGEIAKYRAPSGTVTLGVFSFPTPSFARQQLAQFQSITDAVAKRTGPLVAVAIGPAAAAAKLLETVTYVGAVEENEQPPAKPLELKPQSAGQMVLAILSLAGLLLAFCLLSGLAVGGCLHLARRFGYSAAEGSLTTLHLEGK